jgi:hypothetical protein
VLLQAESGRCVVMTLEYLERRAGRWRPALAAAALTLSCGCVEAPLGPLAIVELATPAREFSGQAHLASAEDGSTVLSWLEPTADDGMALRFTTLAPGAETWAAPRTLAEGADWFINWADFPSVVPITGDLWAAHWLVFQEDFHGYDIYLSLSTDAAASWQPPVKLNTDGLPAEHGFVTLFPLEGDVGAVWLDGRNMIVGGEVVYTGPGGELLGTSVRFARFSADGERLVDEALDELVCDCCQPDVALSAAGPVLSYRDRTPEELRDIVIRRMRDGRWQAVEPLPPDGWRIPGCPINGAAIAADGDDVVVAWFTAPDDEPAIRFARSGDAGETFGEAVDIDTAGSFGHVDVALSSRGDAVVSWLRSGESGVELVMRRVSRSGELGAIETVAGSGVSRPIDFPQMIFAGDRLVFAWTNFDNGSDVKTAIGRHGP